MKVERRKSNLFEFSAERILFYGKIVKVERRKSNLFEFSAERILFYEKIAKGERMSKRKRSFQFEYPEPPPVLICFVQYKLRKQQVALYVNGGLGLKKQELVLHNFPVYVFEGQIAINQRTIHAI